MKREPSGTTPHGDVRRPAQRLECHTHGVGARRREARGPGGKVGRAVERQGIEGLAQPHGDGHLVAGPGLRLEDGDVRLVVLLPLQHDHVRQPLERIECAHNQGALGAGGLRQKARFLVPAEDAWLLVRAPWRGNAGGQIRSQVFRGGGAKQVFQQHELSSNGTRGTSARPHTFLAPLRPPFEDVLTGDRVEIAIIEVLPELAKHGLLGPLAALLAGDVRDIPRTVTGEGDARACGRELVALAGEVGHARRVGLLCQLLVLLRLGWRAAVDRDTGGFKRAAPAGRAEHDPVERAVTSRVDTHTAV